MFYQNQAAKIPYCQWSNIGLCNWTSMSMVRDGPLARSYHPYLRSMVAWRLLCWPRPRPGPHFLEFLLPSSSGSRMWLRGAWPRGCTDAELVLIAGAEGTNSATSGAGGKVWPLAAGREKGRERCWCWGHDQSQVGHVAVFKLVSLICRCPGRNYATMSSESSSLDISEWLK